MFLLKGELFVDDGLIVFNEGSNLDIINQNSNELSLLGRDNGVDIMLQTVYKDKMFHVYPSNDPETFEFVYILNGELEYDNHGNKQVLKANDYFTVKGLKESKFFKAITDVTYLWVINEPTFKKVSEDYRALKELTKKVETKDRFTYNHSEKVAELSIKVAKKLNLDSEMIKRLYLAAELHDIGKINVPDEILNKPGRLTNEEYNCIKKHPGDGADIVSTTGYSHIIDIIRQHHERIDGSGYPFGLKCDQITLEAKIIGVCDSYDAMTDNRAYRNAFNPHYAIDELKRLSGIQYDSEIVDALEEILKEEGII